MKRTLLLVLLVLIAIISLSFSVSAEESFPIWETNADECNMSNDNHYIYHSDKNQTVSFVVPYESNIHLYVYRYADGKIITEEQVTVTRMFDYDKIYFVVTLDKNADYALRFQFYKPLETPATVKKQAWDDSMFRKITPNKKETLTIEADRSINYLISVPKSGFYTLVADGTVFGYTISSYPDDDLENGAEPITYDISKENGRVRYSCYFDADFTYGLEVFGGSKKTTESFTLVPDSPNDQRGILTDGMRVDFSRQNENRSYVFKPSKNGTYIFTYSGINFDISYNGSTLQTKQFFSPGDICGDAIELKKGYTYSIRVDCENIKSSGFFSVSRYTGLKSAELKVLSSGGQIEVALYSEPNVAAGVGVKWSVSDPSVFEISQDWGCYVVLTPKKQGSAVIKAEVGGITKSITVSTEKKVLTLKENVKTNIYGGTNTEPSGLFTPSKTGKYRFTVEPLAIYKTNTSQLQVENPDGTWIGDTGNISNTKTLTLDLKAGVSYKILLTGSVDLTITKEADSPTTVTPTEPKETTPPVDSDKPTQQETKPADTPAVSTKPDDSTPDNDTVSPTQQATQGVETPDENKPEDSVPQETIGDQPGKDSYLTDDMIQDAINNQGDEESIRVPVDENSASMKLTVDSLLLAVSQNKPLELYYPDNTGVIFSNQILSDLSGYAENGELILDVKETAVELLLDAQKKSLDGYKIAKIITVDLTANGEQIHRFNDTVQLIFDNPDPSVAWKAIYIAEDGTIEEMKTLCEDKITVLTDHFSCFALVQDSQATANQSSSGALWIIIGAIAIIAGGGTAAFFILKKKDMLPSFLKK